MDAKIEIDKVMMAEIRMLQATVKLQREQIVFVSGEVGKVEPDLDRVNEICAQAAALLGSDS